MRKLCHSLSELNAFAIHWLSQLTPAAHGATLVGLIGELGAGKTAFTQAVGRALGIKETMTSPTFVIEKFYDLKGAVWARLIHLDCYRLGSAKELLKLNWAELIADPANLILVEWADKVETILPTGSRLPPFKFIDDNTHKIPG